MRFTIIQYSNQFALGGWSWTVLTYRAQRNVITSYLGRSYLLPTRAMASLLDQECVNNILRSTITYLLVLILNILYKV